MTVKTIMRTVDVNPAVENIGFAIGDILPGRKIGVEALIFHALFSSQKRFDFDIMIYLITLCQEK